VASFDHAVVLVYLDGGTPIINAATWPLLHRQDVTKMLFNGPDVTIGGTYQGTAFTVTMHDGGGVRNGSDTVRVQYGSLDTSTLSCPHAGVLVLD
jgi:hypothetical protein